uniref:polyamine-transporting ATPase 13A3-like isoform X6 n=1 Tax=Pristiophorus japonicus TaxID=55135 RepID=UPI00398EF57A
MPKKDRTNPRQAAEQPNPTGGRDSTGAGSSKDDPSPDQPKAPPPAPRPKGEAAPASGTDQHSITELLAIHDQPEKRQFAGSGDTEPQAPLHYRVVNVGEGNEMVIYGYCWSWWRAMLSTLVTILSGGLFIMAFYWRPEWYMKCFCYPCNLQDAEYVLMKTTDEFQEWHRQKVKFMYLKYSPQTDRKDKEALEDVDEFSLLRKNISFTGIQIRYLEHQSIRYIWDPNKRSFIVLRGLEQNVSCSDLHKKYLDGLVYQESQNRKLIYGPNIIAVQVPPYWKLLGKEILNPFYAFQAFSVILWFVEAYYPYAVAIIVMSICSIALSLYTARKEPIPEILLKAFDVITIVVPPALPAAVTVGVVYAQRRLKRRGIYCISPHRINLCGQLDLVCFDKTGTLTENGMDLFGVVRAKNKNFVYSNEDLKMQVFNEDEVLAAMATCHSLTLASSQTTLQGDPLDLTIFRATNWVLEEMISQARRVKRANPLIIVKPTRNITSDTSTTSLICRFRSGIGILRQFPFSSALQRMTVIAKNLDEQSLVAYCKGAPETIVKLCTKESVPDDFLEVMESFTQCGYRVIGLAFREFKGALKESDIKNVNREFVEQNMTFTGLVILENKLKKVTSMVFSELLKAEIRVVMITGDSTLTAIQVAKESGMIGLTERIIRVKAKLPTAASEATVTWRTVTPFHREELRGSPQPGPLSGATPKHPKPRIHFVIDGPSLSVIEDKFPELLPKVTLYGTVFARMSPDMKTKLIKCLQSLDYVVGMCGDGANDCGALKTAHVGISLSQLEASVASPFTSKLPTIECVPILIKEGRAALVTSFCAFKYMALYSMIQYVSVLILYYISSNLGNWEFLYEDLFITSAIAITMSRNKAYEHLVSHRPNANLVSPQLLLSVLMHIALCSTFQMLGFLLVQIQPWYNPWDQGARACASNNTFYGTPLPHPRNNSGILFNMQWKISNYVNTTVFFVSVFQYITIAFVFSMGKPFRKPISTNYLFLAVLVILYLFTLFLMLFPSSNLDTFFEFVCIPYIWRIYILLMVVGHFALSVFLEEVLTNNHRLWNWLSRMNCPSASLVKHKRLHQELQDDPCWPPHTTLTSHKATVQ